MHSISSASLISGFARVKDGAARFVVVGVLFAASVAVLLRAPDKTNAIHPAAAAPAAAPATANSPSAKPALASAYGNLPLRFEANRGQTDPRVRFLARGSRSELFLAGSEAVLVLTKPAAQSTALRFSLLGANRAAQISGVDPQPGVSSYFIGNDPAKWRSDIPSYARIKYHQLYEGVDLMYYGSGRNLEFDFDIAPHADPAQIRLKIEGADSLQAAPSGDVLIATAAGEVRLQRPEIHQLAENRREREKVAGSYALASNDEITLQLGPYDSNRALIVDPVVQYSTFLGGTTSDSAAGIFVDTNGNAYVTGTTSSSDFPTTPGTQQTSLRGTHSNVFVSKLTPNGSTLLYSTYLGGTGATGDQGLAIAVDSQGNAYITGSTSSADFPTVSAFQSTLKSTATNAFAAKLNPTATALLYSTYLGGSGASGDIGAGIAVDSSGSAYVAGFTTSGDFPLQGAIQGTLNNAIGSGFVSKLSADGASLAYSTYLGGSGGAGDLASAITLDSSNDAFVTGATSSTDFPTTTGAVQPNHNGSGFNAFLAELNPSGSALAYSTFLGGSTFNGGMGMGVALDSQSSAYVTGLTSASDFPISPGAAQQTLTGTGGHAFVTKIIPTGQQTPGIAYSTFLGGSNNSAFADVARGIAVDSAGDANVTGHAMSADFPATPGAIQAAPNSAAGNAFLTRLDPAGSRFLYSTTFGGSNAKGDSGLAIALDPSGSAYIAGAAFSSDFPTTAGALRPNFTASSGNSNGFVAKLSANAVINVSPAAIDFGRILLNIPSPPQLVTVTNNSSATLNFSAPPALSGANVGEFSSATTCAASLAPNASCTVTLSFLPTHEGAASASLTFTDDDPSSPQVVPISGVGGLDFTLAGPGSESVSRGDTVTFTVTVTPVDGSKQTVNLTCTGAPMDATCTLAPASIPLDGTDAVSSTVTVTAASLLPPTSRPRRTPNDFTGRGPLIILGLAALAAFALSRRRALRLSFAGAVLACIFFAGCGGGSGGTPTGKFTLVITGTPTDGGMIHTVDVALTVD